MKRFEIGQKFTLTYKAWKKWGEQAGLVEILSISRVPESEYELKETSIKGCFDSTIGEIVFVIHSDTNNLKPKKAPLIYSKNSEDFARKYCHGEIEIEWFSPSARNYQPISARDKQE